MQTKQSIVILGSKGMLGQMCNYYFTKEGFNVNIVNTRFFEENKTEFIQEILSHKPDVVLNCIGKIKQKTEDSAELLMANSLLPLELKNSLPENIILIHPSTDCVFNGNAGRAYSISDVSEASDTYGWSKRLGEVALSGRKNTIVIRVSIIGLDKNPQGKGLLAWFLSNVEGSLLKGYSNHLWNGITTLEWCKFIHNCLLNNLIDYSNGVLFQVGTQEFYSKYEMLELFNNIFSRKYTITSFACSQAVDRRLVPQYFCKNLSEQLNELKQIQHCFIQ